MAVEELRSMLYEALESGWNVEDLSQLLTDCFDAAVKNFQKDQEEEEKEKLVDEIVAIVYDGLREGNWDWNFQAAAKVLHLLGDYKRRFSVQEIKNLIEQEGVKL